MTIDRFLAFCQILWPVLLYLARRAVKAVKHIEQLFEQMETRVGQLDELHESEITQWRAIAALQHDVALLKENAA